MLNPDYRTTFLFADALHLDTGIYIMQNTVMVSGEIIEKGKKMKLKRGEGGGGK